ncbi:uncharacterized protein TNCV_4269471 [Trichonephila clavipes]|nr:uncharacterized protein TNCV_4269471 [Trichonephila clavipes]
MERVNRTLVQMIACFVEENHDNWDRFLHEFSFALRTAANETTGKTPAELFLGRKIITPFRKLVLVKDGAEYVGGSIEKLFDERKKVHSVNVDQVRIYHPRNYDTSSYDSINETIYEGKGSSNWSNRSNSEKSRRSRKPSDNENKSCKSDKGNAGLENLRVKRSNAVESTGTADRDEKKRPKICRKRSFKGSDYEHNKRKAPILPQGLKRGVPSSIYSRSRKNMRKDTNTLRSRFKEPEGLSEEQMSMGIDSLPQNSLRRRSLSMEAVDGVPADRSA